MKKTKVSIEEYGFFDRYHNQNSFVVTRGEEGKRLNLSRPLNRYAERRTYILS